MRDDRKETEEEGRRETLRGPADPPRNPPVEEGKLSLFLTPGPSPSLDEFQWLVQSIPPSRPRVDPTNRRVEERGISFESGP